jgi:hypothetical protein
MSGAPVVDARGRVVGMLLDAVMGLGWSDRLGGCPSG